MSAQLKEGASPVDLPITRVFDNQGVSAKHYVKPDITIEPEDFYGSITKGYTADIRAKLEPLLALSSIAILFGKVTEGRPYTLALRLRELGYAGELHAVGAVNRELMHHLIRVGFTHIHLNEDGRLIAPAIVFPFSTAYQRLGV